MGVSGGKVFPLKRPPKAALSRRRRRIRPIRPALGRRSTAKRERRSVQRIVKFGVIRRGEFPRREPRWRRMSFPPGKSCFFRGTRKEEARPAARRANEGRRGLASSARAATPSGGVGVVTRKRVLIC